MTEKPLDMPSQFIAYYISFLFFSFLIKIYSILLKLDNIETDGMIKQYKELKCRIIIEETYVNSSALHQWHLAFHKKLGKFESNSLDAQWGSPQWLARKEWQSQYINYFQLKQLTEVMRKMRTLHFKESRIQLQSSLEQAHRGRSVPTQNCNRVIWAPLQAW